MPDIDPIALQQALRGAHCPTDRETLVELAVSNEADTEVIERFTQGPPGRPVR